MPDVLEIVNILLADPFVARRILAEDQADELAFADGGAAAVAGIQGGVDLDSHGEGIVGDAAIFDPRNDALGDAKPGMWWKQFKSLF